ncbi:MAG: hypothetical protein VB115_14365 [Christensenellaceae bacterium]|nr:hypothetical protein [Christensenellaceae bacterium]
MIRISEAEKEALLARFPKLGIDIVRTMRQRGGRRKNKWYVAEYPYVREFLERRLSCESMQSAGALAEISEAFRGQADFYLSEDRNPRE